MSLLWSKNEAKTIEEFIYGMYYVDNMSKEEEADNVMSYLLDQGLLDRPNQDDMVITKRGILIWKILNHVIETDKVDVS